MLYGVGDIIWVVGKDRPGLRVYRVVEEVTKRTLDGTITSYRLQTGRRDGKNKLVNMETIDGEFFSDKQEVRDRLLENATSAIDRMISSSEEIIKKLWEPEMIPILETQEKSPEPDGNIIELPDGTKAVLRTNLEDLK